MPPVRIACIIARLLLGFISLVFGLNGFLKFLPMPAPTGVAAQFIGALFVSHYLSVIFVVQLIPAVLPLGNRYVPLALTLLAPVIVNILCFHIFMAAGIAATIRELEARGVRLRDQAVLCRSKRQLNEIAGALGGRGIPVLHLRSLFKREEIRDLLALLTLAVDRFGDGLARIGAMPRYGLSLQDVRLATSYPPTKSGRALISLPELSTIPGIPESGAQGLARLAARRA
jgi:hypothetical protein